MDPISSVIQLNDIGDGKVVVEVNDGSGFRPVVEIDDPGLTVEGLWESGALIVRNICVTDGACDLSSTRFPSSMPSAPPSNGDNTFSLRG